MKERRQNALRCSGEGKKSALPLGAIPPEGNDKETLTFISHRMLTTIITIQMSPNLDSNVCVLSTVIHGPCCSLPEMGKTPTLLGFQKSSSPDQMNWPFP